MAFLLFDDSKKKRIRWLLLDRFTTDRAAGAVNGTLSEPSGHTRTVTDSAPNAVITGGQYKVTAIAAIRDPWLRYTTGWARVAGRMLRMYLSGADIALNRYVAGFATTLVNPLVPNHLGVAGFLGVLNVANGSASSGVQIAPYVDGTAFNAYLILRSTGFYLLIDGKLRWIDRANATATLYPSVEGVNTDAACDLRADNLGVVDLPTSDPAHYPTPTLSDTFSDTVAPLLSDGLAHVEAGGVNGAGVQWNSAATISNSGNKGYISPTPGAELLTNGSFAAWTGDNPDGWGIIGEVGADPEVNEVGTGEGHGGAGTGCANLYSSLTNTRPIIYQDVCTVGQFYRVGVKIDTVVSGGLMIEDASSGYAVTYTTTGIKSHTGRSKNVRFYIFPNPTAPHDVTVDDASVKLLPFSQCLRTVAPTSAAEPYVSAKLTITANTQAGLVINLDSYSNPQNCIHVWLDRIDGKIYARPLIAGTWGADALAGVSVTYSAGAYLEVRRIGTEVYVFYNGAYVGSWTTAVSSANSLVAFFATDAASYAESITSYPTGGYDYTEYA